MKKMFVLIGIVLFVGCSPVKNSNQALILISFDGFRADYLDRVDTPNFDYLIENGVTAPEGMIPSYPTVTFTNHYTIATGLYPKNNGIINNDMYDAEIGKSYSIGNREQVENPAWYRGEPIWNTVVKNGKKAGTMFWVGSETKIQDMRPTYWKTYDGSVPDSARIDTVISWLTLAPDKKIDLATLYFSFVDSQGHRFGPDSEEVTESIKEADNLVGYLVQRLKETQIWDTSNIIIVSDHGMTQVSRDRIIVLDDYINPGDVEIISGSPAVMFNVKNGKKEEVYRRLKQNENHFKVFKKEEIPERLNLSDSDRMPEILLMVDEGYTINTANYFNTHPNYPSGGTHGFDNVNEQMRALFVAEGPAFRKGKEIASFQNIHLYALMAKVMGVAPAENDGNLVVFSEILN